jgi:hypothetical protein
MACVGYNLRARMALAVLVGHAIVKHLSGAIMGQDSFIPVATNARSRSDLVERGFSRQPLRVDVDIARWKRYPMPPGPFKRTNTTMGATGIVP